jgi:hypothetical protein
MPARHRTTLAHRTTREHNRQVVAAAERIMRQARGAAHRAP